MILVECHFAGISVVTQKAYLDEQKGMIIFYFFSLNFVYITHFLNSRVQISQIGIPGAEQEVFNIPFT